MTALPAADVDAFGLLVDPVDAGLAALGHHQPLWGENLAWNELVGALASFHSRWSGPSAAARWTAVQLWGLDPESPRNRLSRMGGAWQACLPGRRVIAVDNVAIRIVCRTSSRLSVYRPEAGGVLAWEIKAAG